MSDDIVARLRILCNWYDAGSYDDLRRDIREAADEIERLRESLRIKQEELDACCIDRRETQRERNEARMQTSRILNEIACRIEHGAESNGHLEAIRNLFSKATDGK